MRLINEEAFDIIGVYFECMRNASKRVASRAYATQFSNQRRHTIRVFRRLIDRLRTAGNINLPVHTRRGRGRTEDNIVNVLAYIAYDPHVGTRTLATELGLEHRYVKKTKKINIEF